MVKRGGAAALVDSSGSVQCARCPSRFTRLKRNGTKVGKKMLNGVAVCDLCYTKERRYGGSQTPDCTQQAPPTPVRRTSSAPLMPLSPQQQTLLRDAVKSDGSGKQGRTAAAKECDRRVAV